MMTFVILTKVQNKTIKIDNVKPFKARHITLLIIRKLE